jgi:hypothetical protein
MNKLVTAASVPCALDPHSPPGFYPNPQPGRVGGALCVLGHQERSLKQ